MALFQSKKQSDNSSESEETKLKIAVTPSGYDDIGAVLQQMDYKFVNISDEQLQNRKLLSKYNVVFLNCSGACSSYAQTSASGLREYVQNGGSLYASDFAADYIEAAFPKHINFKGKTGNAGNVQAKVVDVGLREVLGNQLPLNFDMGSWVQIESVSKTHEVDVYLTVNDKPILAVFNYGDGQVIYTSFHNHAQVSKQEQTLLRFLVLKPLLARAKSAITSLVASKEAGAVEMIGFLTAGESSIKYEFVSRKAGDLIFILNWEGKTKMVLSVFSPDGSPYQSVEADKPPLQIISPSAATGCWLYQVKALSSADKNVPYVVLVGPAIQSQAQSSSSSNNISSQNAQSLGVAVSLNDLPSPDWSDAPQQSPPPPSTPSLDDLEKLEW
ncbi:MAG: hypothetical protein KA003_13815 [Caldilineaceae bacterium]|nr:hypothetical protein [Caldilineaceae bacterium]MBP8107545.1 hypothetical protein [Caldilineaceae bacterium]MBP8122477.1 hypothetical protein [Caldilineaceae bacterium]